MFKLNFVLLFMLLSLLGCGGGGGSGDVDTSKEATSKKVDDSKKVDTTSDSSSSNNSVYYTLEYQYFDSKSTDIKWKKFLGGDKRDEFLATDIDSEGNIYAVGSTESSSITIGYADRYQTLIVKYDKSGGVLWKKTMGGSDVESLYGIAIDQKDNIYVVGWSYSDDGDMVDKNNGLEDALIIKIDKNGNKIWDKSIGGKDFEHFEDITLDKNGNIYLVGMTSSVDGDITDGNNRAQKLSEACFDNCNDALVMKLDSSGQILWNKTIGGSFEEIFYGVDLDKDGNVYAVGYTNSHDKDVSSVSSRSSESDAILTKLDKNGNVIFTKTYGGSGSDFFNDLKIVNDELYVVGKTTSKDHDLNGKDIYEGTKLVSGQ